MDLYQKIISREEKIAVVGLGYVGLPLAIAFGRRAETIGFDINREKIERLRNGIDHTLEVDSKELKESQVCFTADEQELRQALFYIVAVPTPIKEDYTPDLQPLESACKILGRNIRSSSIVVFESTVYPGTTESICVPILEKESGLKCGRDFKVAYSPERINPGDKVHRLESIQKIVSGQDGETRETVAEIYELIIAAGVYRASSIKVAEAAKVIENAQRDINIAFANEISIIFHKLGIDTREVLEAAKTKWNFLDFKPGLVGGHCVGVDPYYLTYVAKSVQYQPEVILSGRRINDNMGKYIAESAVKLLFKNHGSINQINIGILGFTFKENCPDIRNTKVIDIVRELREYDIEPKVVDPIADVSALKKMYQISLKQMSDLSELDVLIIAVAHEQFLNIIESQFRAMFRFGRPGIMIDVKGILNRVQYEEKGYHYWSL